MASDGNDSDKVEIIKPSTKLKNKVGGGPNAKFNAKVIERTEKAVSARGDDYVTKVKTDLNELRNLAQSLKSANPGDTELIRKVAMAARIEKAPWMTPATKQAALTKLSKMLVRIEQSLWPC